MEIIKITISRANSFVLSVVLDIPFCNFDSIGTLRKS
jgi:hypothetical protein